MLLLLELVVGHGCNDANLVIPILAGRVPVKFMLVQVCCIFQTLINNKLLIQYCCNDFLKNDLMIQKC